PRPFASTTCCRRRPAGPRTLTDCDPGWSSVYLRQYTSVLLILHAYPGRYMFWIGPRRPYLSRCTSGIEPPAAVPEPLHVRETGRTTVGVPPQVPSGLIRGRRSAGMCSRRLDEAFRSPVQSRRPT